MLNSKEFVNLIISLKVIEILSDRVNFAYRLSYIEKGIILTGLSCQVLEAKQKDLRCLKDIQLMKTI